MADQEVVRSCYNCCDEGRTPKEAPCHTCCGYKNWRPKPPLVLKGKMPPEMLPVGHPDKPASGFNYKRLDMMLIQALNKLTEIGEVLDEHGFDMVDETRGILLSMRMGIHPYIIAPTEGDALNELVDKLLLAAKELGEKLTKGGE